MQLSERTKLPELWSTDCLSFLMADGFVESEMARLLQESTCWPFLSSSLVHWRSRQFPCTHKSPDS